MKKQIVILFLLIIYIASDGQQTIKTSIPCNDEVLFKTPGRWIKGSNVWQTDHIGFNKVQQQEVLNRMDAVHQLMLKIYPQPAGLDAAWHYTLGYSTFGDQVTYVRTDQYSLDRKAVVEKPVASFGYVSGFFRHYCNTNDLNEIWSGYPGETGTWMRIFANAFAGFATEYFGNQDTITFGGYPVHLRQPLKHNFDGYELFYSKSNVYPEYDSELFVLVHRKGELPYIPVTRKQYLDKCIAHLTKSFDRTIKDFEKVLADQEQEIRKEQVAELIKHKDAVLKHYKDELEATTNQGLLDSPAIIPMKIYDPDENLPIFVEENTGWTIVRANPNYMRKDLPKYVPQFFVVEWQWNDWKSQADVGKLIEEKFPFEKLREMIDK